MTNREFVPYSLACAYARSAARGTLRLCLSIWAALLCVTLPAMADYAANYIQAGVPKLVASDPSGLATLARQGFSVAVSANGNTALVGGPFDTGGAGAAWVFTRSGGGWTQQQRLVADDASECSTSYLSGCSQFGWSVALSADGNTAIVGGPGDNGSNGAAWLFTQSNGVWHQIGAKLIGFGAIGRAEQGYSVALSADGSTAIVGGWADNSALGAAWVFKLSGTSWTQYGPKLVATDATDTTNILQGFSVALSGDGNLAMVGGPNDGTAVGAAWLFRWNGAGWIEETKLIGLNGSDNAIESEQGFAVALSRDGSTAIVGGPGEETSGPGTSDVICAAGATDPSCRGIVNLSIGAAWVFTRSGGVWGAGTMLVDTPAPGSNPGLGFSVAVSGDDQTALVGAPSDNANTGAVWVFSYVSPSQWNPSKLLGTGAVGPAGQASAVALSQDGTTAIIGGSFDNDRTGAAWVFVTQGGLTVSLTGSGSVTSSPAGISCRPTCNASFGNDTNVSLTATTPSGWAFSGWSGACGGSSSNCTVTMSSAVTVTATFLRLFSLTLSDSGGGTITSTQSNINCQTTCDASFASGTQVTLVATPQTGYVFTGWSGACTGNGGCVVTMSMAESVTAMFDPAPARTYVSGDGDDTNPCSMAAPCRTFAGAILKTGINGEINCLGPAGFGTLTINMSITIDCHDTTGSVLGAGANAINIAFDSFDQRDARKTVNLRNLMIQGDDSGLVGVNIFGVGTGSFVNIEDALVNGNYGARMGGVIDFRTNGKLNILNTTIRDMGGSGVTAQSAGGGLLEVMLHNIKVINAGSGVAVGTGAAVHLANSLVSNNSFAGVSISGGGININGTTIVYNGTGIVQLGGSVNLSNDDVSFNWTGISGTVHSYSNNRFTWNGAGGSIVPIGTTSSSMGLR